MTPDLRYYKRRWNESRGDDFARWGASDWYFEVGPDGWPVRQLERIPGGAGIVLDDAMAGIYAALVLYCAGWFNLY